MVWSGYFYPGSTTGDKLTTDRTLTLDLSQETPMGAAREQHATPKPFPLLPILPLCPTSEQIRSMDPPPDSPRRGPRCSKCLRNCCPMKAAHSWKNSHFSNFRCPTSPIAGYTPYGQCSPAGLAALALVPVTELCCKGRAQGSSAAAKQRCSKVSSVGGETDHRMGQPGCPQIIS